MIATPAPEGAARAPAKLRFPCGEPPEPGRARSVAPGVLWLRMPLPSSTLHVNVWAVRDGDGWAVFDTGMHFEGAETIWRSVASPSGPLGGPPTRVFATHLHADHVGMAGWLHREFGCELWMTRTEYLQARLLVADRDQPAPQQARAFYRRAGWDGAMADRYRPLGRHMAALPERYRRLQDGQRVRIGERTWHVVVGSGHSPEHACFHCREHGLLISGDQVLPLISSNVSVHPNEPEADPMHDWLASLEAIRRGVPDDVLVLPAHDDPFHGLHRRLERLTEKRVQTLERLRRALATAPLRAVDTFEALFGRAAFENAFVLQLATGEAIAYLNHLIRRGEATVVEDAAGVAWYRGQRGS